MISWFKAQFIELKNNPLDTVTKIFIVAGIVAIVMFIAGYITHITNSIFIRTYWVCFVLGIIGLTLWSFAHAGTNDRGF